MLNNDSETGYIQISKRANGDTEGLFSTSNIQDQDKQKPQKYDPPSPRNNLPKGQLNNKKPSRAPMIYILDITKSVSSTL